MMKEYTGRLSASNSKDYSMSASELWDLISTQENLNPCHPFCDSNEVISWEDIPYATPPEGDLRWKAPRPLITPDFAIQPQERNGCLQEASIYAGIKGEGIVGQEDCLYLDIKAPVNNLNRRLTVMFWIHGGGNTSGIEQVWIKPLNSRKWYLQ